MSYTHKTNKTQMKNPTWILFSIANKENQPAKAFERIWFHKPTSKDVGECLGFGHYCAVTKAIAKMNKVVLPPPYCKKGNMYWIEKFEDGYVQLERERFLKKISDDFYNEYGYRIESLSQ